MDRCFAERIGRGNNRRRRAGQTPVDPSDYVHASSVCIRAAEGVGPYDSRFDIHEKACLWPEGRRQPKEECLTWLFIYGMMKT